MGNMPNWDLTDLYQSIEDKKIKEDLDKIKDKSKELSEKYKGKLEKISANEFFDSIKLYEEIEELVNLIGSYAYLNLSTQYDNSDALSFYQNISEEINEHLKPTIFYTIEINKLPETKIKELFDNENVQKYKKWLETVLLYKPYTLTEELEELLGDKSIPANDAWVRLYDEVSAKLEYEVDGKKYNDAEISKLMLGENEDLRKKACLEINRVTKENSHIFSLITNTLAKDKQISDKKRGYKTTIASRNLANDVEDEVVEALVNSVRNNYKNISHRYYKLKAKWMGKEKLEYWDRNAPLPFLKEKEYDWDKSVEIVREAYNRFSPKLYNIAKDFFDNNWIDVPTAKSKRSGAYAMPVTTSTHPYLFLNHTDKSRDVLTLAHELGHGCHMVLANSQGELQASTPLTLAETASIFGEMVTFKSMLEKETDDKAKLCMIAGKVEDMINSAIRQISFHCFEDKVHKNRKNGEIQTDTLCEYWLEEMRTSLGDGINVDENIKYFWAQIPHFIHTPYYVYAYSFADCLVNSLYKVYEDGNIENFEDKYLDMLAAGGSKNHKELLAPFGLDASKQDFWESGLKVISDYIDELEELSNKLEL